MKTFLKQFFCSHNAMQIWRCHAKIVPASYKDKLVFIDRLNVHNFIRCQKCEKVFNPYPVRERIFDSIE